VSNRSSPPVGDYRNVADVVRSARDLQVVERFPVERERRAIFRPGDPWPAFGDERALGAVGVQHD